IANAEGFTSGPFAQVGELRASLAFWPLLARRVEIREIALVKPQISLEVDAKGRNNWTFGTTGVAKTRAAEAASDSAPAPFVRKPGALPFEAALGNVRIVDGQASYKDQKANASHAVTAINVTLHMPDLGDPLTLDGGFALDGDPVKLSARLDSLRSFF